MTSDASRRVPLDGFGMPRTALLHGRCGRRLDEHPHGSPNLGCPFDPLPPVEFAPAPDEPLVRIVGLPDTALAPTHPVMVALADLAGACREAYGMGVQVDAPDHLDEVRDALDVIRRRLNL